MATARVCSGHRGLMAHLWVTTRRALAVSEGVRPCSSHLLGRVEAEGGESLKCCTQNGSSLSFHCTEQHLKAGFHLGTFSCFPNEDGGWQGRHDF